MCIKGLLALTCNLKVYHKQDDHGSVTDNWTMFIYAILRFACRPMFHLHVWCSSMDPVAVVDQLGQYVCHLVSTENVERRYSQLSTTIIINGSATAVVLKCCFRKPIFFSTFFNNGSREQQPARVVLRIQFCQPAHQEQVTG